MGDDMSTSALSRYLRSLAFLLLICVAPVTAGAQTSEARLSISGYDPVAYFTLGRATRGSPEFEHVWRRARWRFVSAAHRDLFISDPNRYAPQYDGYCAFGAADLASAHKDTVDPEAWAIIDGRLFLVRTREALGRWREAAAQHIRQADADWAAVADLPDPVIIGAPCAVTAPPTNAVTLRDGRRLLMIGAQAPRDPAGNIVGRGDMRAQIEQVGRNLEACLQAAGAAVGDLIATTTFATTPADLDRHADLMTRYLGRPTEASRILRTPQMSDPAIMVEIEAVALIK